MVKGNYFHAFIKTDYPTRDELRQRNSDIGPDLNIEMTIAPPAEMRIPDVFQLGSYLMFSEASLELLNADFLHTLSKSIIRSNVDEVISKNYTRVVIDRTIDIIDFDKSEIKVSKLPNFDIELKTPKKLYLREEHNHRGLFFTKNLLGLVLCDFSFAKRYIQSGLEGLNFYHPKTPYPADVESCWLSQRGLEKDLPRAMQTKKKKHELILPFNE